MAKEFTVALIITFISAVKFTDCASDTYEHCINDNVIPKKCPSVTTIEEVGIGHLNFTMPTEKEIAKDRHLAGIFPLHYTWTTNFVNETNFEGRTKILIKSSRETNRIVLNVYKLKLYPNSISLHLCAQNADTICVSKFAYSEKERFVILDLLTALKSNEIYVLDFQQYEGSIGYHDDSDEDTSAGIWRNNFESTTWALATIFQMRSARKAFPCFDHPALKATFDICIEHSSDTTAMSNREVDKETKLDNGRVFECFKRTPRVSTYVTTVSLMANFTKLVDSSKHPKIDIIFSSSENESKFRWQIAEARRILDFFQTELKLQYNLTRLGLLNLSPVQFWGIENFGLVSMESGTPANMDNREELIHRILVHEIIHQWLGNVATISYWDEVCLQEGLTALLEWTITDKLKLANTSFDKKLKDTLRDTWYTGQRYLERIVDRIIEKFSRTQSIANYCFNRPPIILNMISYSYGSDIWLKFIGKLVDRYSYANANFEDWISLLSEVAGNQDASEVLKSWYSEKGYPIVYARAESPKKIHLQQKIVDDYEDPSVPVKGLTIPFRVGSQAFLSNTILLKSPQQSLDINITIDKWFLLDPDFVTISRKLYPPINYIGLIDCYYGPNNGSCKINQYQFEETFSFLCVALQDDLVPWSFGSENDTNVEDWKNLTTKLRDVVINKDAKYFARCKCAVLLKEDITNTHKECVYNWNGKWMKSKLMKMLGRTYKINKPSNEDK